MATHTFLFDDACPMCKGYTGVFTGLNWSERRAFSKLKAGDIPNLDLDRGRHEIPLYNAETGEVRYGLEAMTTVIGNALPHLKPLIRSRFFITALKPLYWLITYNRRVIAGTKPPKEGFDCAPDYHVGWRLAYLCLMTSAILLLGLPDVPLLIGFGLALVAGLLLHRDRLTFLGHFVTVVFMATILLAVVPGVGAVVLAYGVSLIEGWRRL
ncbi:hypothetical protein [Neolewinella persica]|uniref:hypothetical protein n=1 Tax=Neolewinella persica TaxID=70998 RepID=UPI0003750532|nr:hypothetical protein [Neolewinella persica]